MTDREKVIEILEKAKMIIEKWVPMFEQYNTPAGIDDAITLLKEQEAKLVEIDGELGGIKYGRCPKCGKGLNEEVYPHWCGFCGQAVKFDDK